MADGEYQMTQREVETLKARFVEAGCEVSALDETSFEVLLADYPVVTRVFANPFYLEWSTVIQASKGEEHRDSRALLLDFVNGLNLSSSLAKFVLDLESQDSNSHPHSIIVTAKLMNGQETRKFNSEQLHNFHSLWLQDIANAINSDGTLELEAMLRV
ncbi:hypothetical protein [Aeoliella sp.]|uniref:hypothetical protein n=1 Tax=Aeoliella sp. TaxID=2795800 RepID=UPI003CCBE9DF